MNNWQSEDQRQKIPIPWRLYLMIGFVSLLVVVTMAYILQQTKNISATHDTLLEVISEIELKFTTAHLWLEEILSGDVTQKIETVRNSLDQAEEHLNALKRKEFDSGEHASSHGASDLSKDIVIFHLDHQSHVMLSIQESIESIEEKLIIFRKILEKRYSAWQMSGPGTEIGQSLDVVFAQLQKGTDEIREKIHASKANHLAQFRIMQTVLLFICLALAVLVALILHRFDRRRANALLAEWRSKDSLKKSEKKYRTLIESASEAIIVAQDGVIKFANPKGVELYGRSQEELASRPLTYFIHEEDREMVGERHKKRLKGEDPPSTYSFRIVDKNGNIKWVELSVVLFSWDDRPATLCFMTDITERMRAEKELRESEEKYRTVLGANPDPIVVYDSEGKVLYLNPAFTSIFGWSSEERIGKRMDVFVPDEAWPETKMMIDKVLAGEVFSGIETHRYTKEGKLIPVSISGATYEDLEGNHVGTVVNLRDISEQKRIEAQLQQAKKLEAIGILAGGLAHDFNNLLSIIVGNIDLAKDDIKPEVGISENLIEAEKASFRAKELTKQLITFSRGGEPVKEVSSIGDLVKDTTNLTISGSNAKCEFSLPENLWLAEFDEGQMKYAIRNLIDNAIESMPEGGSFKVQAENFESDSETAGLGLPLSEGKYIKISIRDQGIGIPEEHLSKIFDPYFSTKEMGIQKGMGLGLSTTYSIIKKHDGYIDVGSKKGHGTNFYIYLPASDEKITEAPPVTERFEKGIETILLVDDEEMVLDVGVKMLETMGYDVLGAKSGQKAIDVYKQNKDKIDLVILDMIMPGMGGGEAFDKMKEINPEIKVLLFSGYSIEGMAQEILDRGCKGFIQKPFNLEDLSQKIRKILHQD